MSALALSAYAIIVVLDEGLHSRNYCTVPSCAKFNNFDCFKRKNLLIPATKRDQFKDIHIRRIPFANLRL